MIFTHTVSRLVMLNNAVCGRGCDVREVWSDKCDLK